MHPAASEVLCRAPAPPVVRQITRALPFAQPELRPQATSLIPRGRVLFWQDDRQSEDPSKGLLHLDSPFVAVLTASREENATPQQMNPA